MSRIAEWFSYRFPFRTMARGTLVEEIPGGISFFYIFGSVTAFVFFIQVVTGVWQLFFYVPSVDNAYQSVMYLRRQVPFGWLIHGLHYWGANAFIILMSLHLARVFIWGAYKRPRQLTWMLGVVLLLLVLLESFSGALLPWDELGYWAAEVGTSIAGTVPYVGHFFKEFMRGGAAMDQATLSRFFIVHVAILAGLLMLVLIMHLIAFRRFGSVGPWNESKRQKKGLFWPDQALMDLLAIAGVFTILVGLCAFWPPPVTGPADHLDNTITPKPEWQFLFLYQFLKLFKGPVEPLGTVGVPTVLTLLVLLVPFLDRGKSRNPFRRPIAMLCGLALVGWLLTYAALGYLSRPSTAGTHLSTHGLSGDVKAGARLFQQHGCLACHTVHGQGGSLGPDLSKEGQRGRSRQWLITQIRDPKKHDPQTVMPAFPRLSDQQVSQLADFLESLGGSAAGKSAASSRGGDPPSPVEEGKQAFASNECLGCHTVHGVGGKVGPDLSNEGDKGRSDQWLASQLRDPKHHDPSTIMPAFKSLSDQTIQDLVAYLQSLKPPAPGKAAPAAAHPSAAAPPATPGPPGKAAYLVGNPPHGKLLFEQRCMHCHSEHGAGGVANPGTSSGTIPQVKPIRPALFSHDPDQFALNIDPYIQHGSTPAGPHPGEKMPGFGDNLTLSQPMIAEIEAYVLELNGVNRAAIMHPGVEPRLFFLIAAASVGGAMLVVIVGWSVWTIARSRPLDAS